LSADEQIATLEALAEQHLSQEIQKYSPDAWIDHSKSKIGYEIPFTRQFYSYIPPRPVAEIRSEISNLESEIQNLMKDLA
jgi:type I restriction enzyme M protein